MATNRLLALGPTRETDHAVRRVLSLQPAYRQYLLTLLLDSVRQLADDRALAATLEQLDHLSAELLPMVKVPLPAHSPPSPPAPLPPRERGERAPSPWMGEGWGEGVFSDWNRAVWQVPDAVTLLSKVVERPADIAPLTPGPSPGRGEGSDVVVPVGFDWLDWETPPAHPAPAPVGDIEPLASPLAAARHPFWGALVATLDACTGDYPWQSLMLRGAVLRSRHRALGQAESQLVALWRDELGVYPALPLVLDPLTPAPSPAGGEGRKAALTPGNSAAWGEGRNAALSPDPSFFRGQGRGGVPWLEAALEQMARAGVAVLNEGTWRLTDDFRTRLMQDDEHMRVFEAIRRRSYRLAQAAERLVDSLLASAEQGETIVAKRASRRKGTGHAVL